MHLKIIKQKKCLTNFSLCTKTRGSKSQGGGSLLSGKETCFCMLRLMSAWVSNSTSKKLFNEGGVAAPRVLE